jgi:hypothetical protein
MSLGYAMELVAVLACGMAVANRMRDGLLWLADMDKVAFLLELDSAMGPFLGGVALAGGIGLAAEGWRKRSPAGWDWGRWSWSAAFIASFVTLIQAAGHDLSVEWLSSDPRSWAEVTDEIFTVWSLTFSYAILPTLVGVLAMKRLSTSSGVSCPDGREWAGRALAAAIALWSVTNPHLLALLAEK